MCHKKRNSSSFHKCAKNKDGLQCLCKDCHKIYRKNWLEKNKEKYSKQCKKWRDNNKVKCYNSSKKWMKNNKEKFKKFNREYKAYKRKTDMSFKITTNLRNRVRKAIKGINKSKTTIELIGCNIEEFMIHIERQFKKGMTWENYGEWELDHIKPCCSFDLLKESEQKKCFNYSNSQPLWKKEHREKTKEDVKTYLYDF